VRAALALAPLALLAACVIERAEEPVDRVTTAIVVVQGPDARLPPPGTFSFARGSEVRSPRADEAKGVDRILRDALTTGLGSIGFQSTVGADATLLVGYLCGFERDLGAREIRERFGFSADWTPPGEELGRFEKAALVLFVADGRSGRLLWRASATGLADVDLPAEERRDRLTRLVASMLERLPARR